MVNISNSTPITWLLMRIFYCASFQMCEKQFFFRINLSELRYVEYNLRNIAVNSVSLLQGTGLRLRIESHRHNRNAHCNNVLLFVIKRRESQVNTHNLSLVFT